MTKTKILSAANARFYDAAMKAQKAGVYYKLVDGDAKAFNDKITAIREEYHNSPPKRVRVEKITEVLDREGYVIEKLAHSKWAVYPKGQDSMMVIYHRIKDIDPKNPLKR